MKLVLRILLVVIGLVLISLPIVMAVSGRDELVLSAVAVSMAGLCSFVAYRGAVLIRRRIDAIGAAHDAPRVEREH